MCDMQASFGRVISSSGRDCSAQGTHCRALELCLVMPNGFQPGECKQLSLVLPAVSGISCICWLHRTELGPLRRAAASAVVRCAVLCCATLAALVLCIF